MKKVIVAGGGPAGMMAAAVAARQGANVDLLEKKDAVGKKLAITGKGRCNLTSAAENDRFMAGYACNGRFLFSALNDFSNHDLIEFFAAHGLQCKVERGQRVFPQSDQAMDVVNILHQNLISSGVKVKKNMPVKALYIEHNTIKGIETEKGKLHSDAVIIATGGMSYPGTGSTGDGYRWAKAAGHHIINPRPGLVPLVTEESWVKELQGLSLKNVRVSSYRADGKKINEEFGEMLFTHFGVSGPIILSMSRDIGEYLFSAQHKVKLVLDLKPALDDQQLDQRLQRDLAKYARRQFKNALDELLPRKFIPVIINLSKIDPDKECHQVTRDERKKLLHLLKYFELSIVKTRPLAEAIVTAGGVDVKEVNPRTMESRLLKGLFFAGEILDVDGYTGGFNLQAAFSTGFVAGKNAALL
ncbi:MAG: NAD(P)/FAD-dependent oxidoreductase [Syntrophomonadaceae bacterium]|nr:NAD(P)/FAD-dependent oxidoreductase [Syntrophomonadaceae bacterium]MDD3023326.1 NAD(P)/FAD-dependent oxidoreductase [Syntrophomonadaceae bacterium]